MINPSVLKAIDESSARFDVAYVDLMQAVNRLKLLVEMESTPPVQPGVTYTPETPRADPRVTERVPVERVPSKADRQLAAIGRARQQGYTGDMCPDCGQFTMIRTGTCLRCLCGWNGGCG